MSKKGGYVTMRQDEIQGFLSETSRKEPYKLKGHSFVPLKGVGKNYCKGCGLVRLHNKITDWCVKKGCNYSDHSAHKTALKRLTKMRW